MITITNNMFHVANELINKGKIGSVPVKRLVLLWEIFVETDLQDIELMEEKIYQYGSYLEEKDYLGRIIFMRMEYLLRMAKDSF